MPPAPNNQVSPRVERWVATTQFLMTKGGLGLVLVVIFGITAFVQRIFAAAFTFPPPWLQVLHLLLPIVAFASWSAVRVWTYEEDSEEDERSPLSLTWIIRVLSYRTTLTLAGKIPSLTTIRARLAVASIPTEPPPSQRPRLIGSILTIAAGLAFFVAYFAVADTYTAASVRPDDRPPANPTADHATTAPSMAPIRFVFPLYRGQDDFENEMEIRGGRTFVIDNDPYWLADRLKDPDVAPRVLWTKLLVMFLLLLATALVTAGTTLLSSLRKSGFGHHDGLEAGAAETPVPHG